MFEAKQVDVAVVGCGLFGLWATIALQRLEPGLRLAMIDQKMSGSAASMYSAGLHVPFARTSRARILSKKSEVLNLAVGKMAEGIIFDQKLVVVGDPPPSWRPLVRAVGDDLDWGTLGRPGQKVGPTYEVSCAHYANTRRLTEHLVRQSRLNGALVLEGAKAVAVEGPVGGIGIELADGRRIACRSAILALGAWAMIPPFDALTAAVPLRIKRVITLVLAIAPTQGETAIYLSGPDAFLLPRPDLGCWLFSYTSNAWIERLGNPTAASRQDLEDGAAVLATWRPDLVARISGVRSHPEAYTADKTPVAMISPARSDVVLALAGSGSGYRLGPAVGEEAAKLALMALDQGAPYAHSPS